MESVCVSGESTAWLGVRCDVLLLKYRTSDKRDQGRSNNGKSQGLNAKYKFDPAVYVTFTSALQSLSFEEWRK